MPMPYAPPKVCAHAGCGRVVVKGSRCALHAVVTRARDSADRRYDERRGSRHERGYDARWTRLRRWYLTQHPLCAHCEARGRVRVATEVDHVQELRYGGAVYDEGNLQALCHACHMRKTAANRPQSGP
jgi:5-methylcytosine-specific restriction protein A